MKIFQVIKPILVIGLLFLLLIGGTSSVLADKDDILKIENKNGNLQAATKGNEITANPSFLFVPGSAFLTVDSSQTWAYDYMGCIHATAGGDSLMNYSLQLPQGSRIVLLRVYYDDTNAGIDGHGWITIYPEGGESYEDLVSVPTGGNSGHGSNYGNLDHIVNNYYQNYVLVWRPNVASTNMQLCGMRVMYYRPITSTFLPVTIKK